MGRRLTNRFKDSTTAVGRIVSVVTQGGGGFFAGWFVFLADCTLNSAEVL